MSEQIGFIGLGKLGLPVASNLLSSGYSLRVYNRTASKAEPLVEQGAQVVERPADVVTEGGIVVTLLWDDQSVESIVTSESFLKNLGQGGIHISMSTISPEMAKKLAKIHEENGSIYVEAPIFGPPPAAVARQLFIPLAGPQQARERVRPLLTAMGAAGIYDFGEEAGAAVLVKLIGNFLIVSAGHSMREGLALARKSGVDPRAVVDMLTGTLFNAPIYKSYGARIAENDQPFGQSKIPLKDVGLFQKTAREVDVPADISSFLEHLLQEQV